MRAAPPDALPRAGSFAVWGGDTWVRSRLQTPPPPRAGGRHFAPKPPPSWEMQTGSHHQRRLALAFAGAGRMEGSRT